MKKFKEVGLPSESQVVEAIESSLLRYMQSTDYIVQDVHVYVSPGMSFLLNLYEYDSPFFVVCKLPGYSCATYA